MPMPANAEEAKDSNWQVSSSASQLKIFYRPWTVFSLPLFLFLFSPSPPFLTILSSLIEPAGFKPGVFLELKLYLGAGLQNFKH